MSARIRFHIHDLVGAVSDAILDLVGELFGRYLLRVKEDFAIAHNCHNERIFPVGILHRNRIERLRQVDGHAFLQHGRDHHEDDEQHQHHVDHRGHVDVGVDLGALVSNCYCHNVLLCGLPPHAHAALLQEIIDQLAGGVVHLHVKGFDFAGEVVEHHHSGDGHEQSQSGGHQSFRNTTSDSSQTGLLLLRDLAEGVENSDYGAEQSDERGRGTDGGEAAKSALQFSMDNGLSTLQGALAGFNLLAGNLAGIAMGLEFLEAGSYDFGQVALLVALGNTNGFIQLAFAQCSGNGGSKLARLFTGGAESDPTVNHHADGPCGHDEQDDNHGAGQPAHLLPQ